ncbi:hypothetical protein JB92DRAFT_123033 [Gautieria morchelliformis]|nr:hypothetical protein JB92DRAFT_123033 [Gautieria morchelliformis]
MFRVLSVGAVSGLWPPGGPGICPDANAHMHAYAGAEQDKQARAFLFFCFNSSTRVHAQRSVVSLVRDFVGWTLDGRTVLSTRCARWSWSRDFWIFGFLDRPWPGAGAGPGGGVSFQ